MNSVNQTNPSSTEQESAKTVGAYTRLELQKNDVFKTLTSLLYCSAKLAKLMAVVVAQLAERSLPASEIRGSSHAISKVLKLLSVV